MEIQTYVLGCNSICAFYRTGEHDCSDKCPLRNMECGSLMNEDDTIQDPLNAERAAAAEKIIRDFMAGYVRTNHNNPLPSENKRPGMGLTFPQDDEKNEYRYLYPAWLDAIACGLTAGNKKHPGATWKTIPAYEHAARAMRHINLFMMGDASDNHLANASMRLMMAFATAKSAKKEYYSPGREQKIANMQKNIFGHDR